MIDVDLDFIIKGIESQGATCITKPRNARLQLKKVTFITMVKLLHLYTKVDL